MEYGPVGAGGDSARVSPYGADEKPSQDESAKPEEASSATPAANVEEQPQVPATPAAAAEEQPQGDAQSSSTDAVAAEGSAKIGDSAPSEVNVSSDTAQASNAVEASDAVEPPPQESDAANSMSVDDKTKNGAQESSSDLPVQNSASGEAAEASNTSAPAQTDGSDGDAKAVSSTTPAQGADSPVASQEIVPFSSTQEQPQQSSSNDQGSQQSGWNNSGQSGWNSEKSSWKDWKEEVKIHVKYDGRDGPCNTVFIGGLPSPAVDTDILDAVLNGIGLSVVSSRAIADRGGRGQSSAVVQFSNLDDAHYCIQILQGEVFPEEGRAKPKYAIKYAGADAAAGDSLYITGLPSPQIDPYAFQKVFLNLGFTVRNIRPLADRESRGNSACLVRFFSQEEAERAMNALNGKPIEDLEGIPVQENMGKGGVNFAPEGKGMGKDSPQLPACGGWKGGPPCGKGMMDKGAGFGGLGAPPCGKGGKPGMFGFDNTIAGLGKGGKWGKSLTMTLKFAGDGMMPSENIYINGLPSPKVDEMNLRQFFFSKGLQVETVRPLADIKGIGSSAALVRVASVDQARQAIDQLNGVAFPNDVGQSDMPALNDDWGPKSMPAPLIKAPFVVKAPFAAKGPLAGKGMNQMPFAGKGMNQMPFAGKGFKGDEPMNQMPFSGKGFKGKEPAPFKAPFTVKAGPYSGPGKGMDQMPPTLSAPSFGAAPSGDTGVMNVRFAGKKGDDEAIPPSDYLTLSGFPNDVLPSEDRLRSIFKTVDADLKRMRAMNGHVMAQVGSVEEAEKVIDHLHGWPLPSSGPSEPSWDEQW